MALTPGPTQSYRLTSLQIMTMYYTNSLNLRYIWLAFSLRETRCERLRGSAELTVEASASVP